MTPEVPQRYCQSVIPVDVKKFEDKYREYLDSLFMNM